MRSSLSAALAGIAATAIGVGLAELGAALVVPAGSPVLGVGGMLIDLAPPWAKDLAILLFGTADKIALVAGIAIVLAGLAAVSGVLEARRPPGGRALIGIGAVAGMMAVATRTAFSPLDALPSLLAGAVALITLPFLVRRRPEVRSETSAADPARRRFLGWSIGAVAVAALSGIAASALHAAHRTVAAVREAVALPMPTVAAAIPASASFAIDGLSPVITPNRDFYRIDTALRVPQLDPREWSLRVHGLVDSPVELSWDELTALPLEESITTLMCVSNEVGGELIGTARWLGYPIRELLGRRARSPAPTWCSLAASTAGRRAPRSPSFRSRAAMRFSRSG